MSCELGVTVTQETFLSIALYISLALTTFATIFITNSLGPRKTSLLALYLSILFTVLCAVVPNYWTLLLSRIMIGIGIGMNTTPSGVFFTNGASCRKVYLQGTFVWIVAFEMGAAYVGVLGYFVLEYLSWREFILLTSMPLLVPPILLLHFVVTEDITASPDPVDHEKERTRDNSASSSGAGDGETECILERNTVSSPKFPALRLLKASLCPFLTFFLAFGNVLLLPILLREIKLRRGKEDEMEDRCAGAVQGSDYLLLAIINSGMIVGAILGGWLHDRFPFKIVYPTVAAFMTACLMILSFYRDVYWFIVLFGFIFNAMLEILDTERYFTQFDALVFGRENLTVVSSVIQAAASFGSLFGSSCAAFIAPPEALIVCTIANALLIFAMFLLK